jgi:signal transduction histidine kinase
MSRLLQNVEPRQRALYIIACLTCVALVGTLDYLTGFELFFSVFYLLAVGVATWFVGRGFGLFISFLSVVVGIGADVAAGAHYSSSFVPIWNGTLLAVFYILAVWLLSALRSLQKDLENRVQQRTIALTQEMAERERLEKEVLEASERERRRLGRELHDSLCQHLTGTALAGQVLEEKLAAKSAAEAADARQVVGLVEDGITLARDMARGLYPIEVDAEGLMDAFGQLASQASKWSKANCDFECAAPVLVHDAATATQLYRIAQEAVRNAIQHGKPGRILIHLADSSERLTLTVEDDGEGLPDHWQKGVGLGTRIMAHRAAMIGATLTIEPNPTGGTLVRCALANNATRPAPFPAETI